MQLTSIMKDHEEGFHAILTFCFNLLVPFSGLFSSDHCFYNFCIMFLIVCFWCSVQECMRVLFRNRQKRQCYKLTC